MTALMTASSEARACEARGVVDIDRHHWRCAGSPLGRHGGEPTIVRVPVCAAASADPLAACRTPVEVLVALADAPASPDFSVRARTEQNRARSLERDVLAAAERRRLFPRPVMFYGIEPEAAGQLQLKREMLFVLARVSGQGLIGRAAAGLGPTSSLRAFAEAEALESTRIRATYLQVEELMAPNPLVNSWTVQAGFAATGASLFWAGLAGEKLLDGALGAAFAIHPQIWPPGIEVKGSFGSP
jgi:hypothetical protein